MIRAVLYLRSSKDRSDISIDAQRRALGELAHARSIAIVGEYADAVESGKDTDRPAFQRLLRDIKAADRAWNHILVLDTARIARRRELAIIFEEHECKRRGVRILYKSLPDADPITEMLLKSVLQAMDEWHSLTSRAKGLAGMAENVRQGWRAGGRAPRGYRLVHHETGAIRDGLPVTKTRLAIDDDALQVRAYLQHRARGVKRTRALQLAGVNWPVTSLIETERNALLYAGHTVWNRTAERTDDGYVGGNKWRPRAEWVIQRDTHEALISEAEAETLLDALAIHRRVGGKPARRCYILAGLLVDETGAPWYGDAGAYRLGKGQRIQAEATEHAIVQQVVTDLQSPPMAEAIATHYRRLGAERKTAPTEAASLRRKIADLDRQCTRLADLMTETSAPAPLLRRIEALETDRDAAVTRLTTLESQDTTARALRDIDADQVRRMLRGVTDRMAAADPEALRDALRQLMDKVELRPSTYTATLTYRVGPAMKTGEWLASPRGTESFPAFTIQTRTVVPHNRRRRA